jgi:hypothetical protein
VSDTISDQSNFVNHLSVQIESIASAEKAKKLLRGFKYLGYTLPPLQSFEEIQVVERNSAFFRGLELSDYIIDVAETFAYQLINAALEILTQQDESLESSTIKLVKESLESCQNMLHSDQSINPNFKWFRNEFDKLPDDILIQLQKVYLQLLQEKNLIDGQGVIVSNWQSNATFFDRFANIGLKYKQFEAVQASLSEPRFEEQTRYFARNVFKSIENLFPLQYKDAVRQLKAIIEQEDLIILRSVFNAELSKLLDEVIIPNFNKSLKNFETFSIAEINNLYKAYPQKFTEILADIPLERLAEFCNSLDLFDDELKEIILNTIKSRFDNQFISTSNVVSLVSSPEHLLTLITNIDLINDVKRSDNYECSNQPSLPIIELLFHPELLISKLDLLNRIKYFCGQLIDYKYKVEFCPPQSDLLAELRLVVQEIIAELNTVLEVSNPDDGIKPKINNLINLLGGDGNLIGLIPDIKSFLYNGAVRDFFPESGVKIFDNVGQEKVITVSNFLEQQVQERLIIVQRLHGNYFNEVKIQINKLWKQFKENDLQEVDFKQKCIALMKAYLENVSKQNQNTLREVDVNIPIAKLIMSVPQFLIDRLESCLSTSN